MYPALCWPVETPISRFGKATPMPAVAMPETKKITGMSQYCSGVLKIHIKFRPTAGAAHKSRMGRLPYLSTRYPHIRTKVMKESEDRIPNRAMLVYGMRSLSIMNTLVKGPHRPAARVLKSKNSRKCRNLRSASGTRSWLNMDGWPGWPAPVTSGTLV